MIIIPATPVSLLLQTKNRNTLLYDILKEWLKIKSQSSEFLDNVVYQEFTLPYKLIILAISLQSIYMHYLFPFFSQERQGKLFVTICSILMIIISILYIAYAGRNIHLYHKASDYGVTIIKDPHVGYYLFFGIQGVIVFLYNIIENWKQYRLADQSEPKWWIVYWLMLIQGMFTFAAGSCTTGSRNVYAPIIAYIQAYQATPGINSDLYDYLQSWVHLYRFLLAILIITFILGLPIMLLLGYGLAQRLRAYRIDVAKEGMHRNPELDVPSQNKPSVTKL